MLEYIIFFMINFLRSTIRTSVPIALTALGMVYNERAGVVNIGGEGMMLIGALTGVVGVFYTDSLLYGFIFAIFIGGIMGLLFAFAKITMKADQIVFGIAFNLFALGLTTSLYRLILGGGGERVRVETFQVISIPYFSEIPIIGPVVFQQTPLTYLTVVLAFVSHYILFNTTFGLKLRSVGEVPVAADTMGINVFKIRYIAMIIGGIFAGMGGAVLSIDLVSTFAEDMVAGRGFIAIAAVIFGKYSPISTFGAALLFSSGYAAVYRIQAMGLEVPHQFIHMIPYLLTVGALSGFVGKVTPPAASTEHYERESE